MGVEAYRYIVTVIEKMFNVSDGSSRTVGGGYRWDVDDVDLKNAAVSLYLPQMWVFSGQIMIRMFPIETLKRVLGCYQFGVLVNWEDAHFLM